MTKIYLQHVRLDKGGYDENGRYFGQGQKVYRYCGAIDDRRIAAGLDRWEYIRAVCRADAKHKVRQRFNNLELSFFN